MTKTTRGKWCWHVHHDRLVERLSEPIESRVLCIHTTKPPNERRLRLRLIKVVKDQRAVTMNYEKFKRAFNETWDSWRKTTPPGAAEKDLIRAAEIRSNAIKLAQKTADEELDKLHRKECGRCPWNGKTIFSRRRRA